MSHETLVVLITALTTFAASSGFWSYISLKSSQKSTKKSATDRLIMGLAYDKATGLGLEHIQRGYISRDELEDFQKYLYGPYKELGGNGVVERIMNEVLTLPIANDMYIKDRVVPK